MALQGIATSAFGFQLHADLSKTRYRVFYDHGDRAQNPNVTAIEGYYGGTISRMNRIADFDLLIGYKGKAVLLVETEERPSSPKKILGNILSALIVDNCSIINNGSQENYSIDSRTHLVICGLLPNQGKRLARINDVIKPAINRISSSCSGGKIVKFSIDKVGAPQLDFCCE